MSRPRAVTIPRRMSWEPQARTVPQTATVSQHRNLWVLPSSLPSPLASQDSPAPVWAVPTLLPVQSPGLSAPAFPSQAQGVFPNVALIPHWLLRSRWVSPVPVPPLCQ